MRKITSAIIQKIFKLSFYVLGKLPANEKLVIFESFHGKQYSDNPRAIFEYMRVHYPKYKLYWSVDRRNKEQFIDNDILIVKRFTVKWVFIMTRAKYWIINSRLPIWIP